LRIEPRHDAAALRSLVEDDVRRARAPGPTPDPVCCGNCPDYRPATGCHRDCPAAARRLSSEGEHSPVEPLVAPLVFELKKLGVFHPCWSCEGHTDQAGNLSKTPRVWFYADSVVHVRALADAINRLFYARRLAARWQLVLTYSDPTNPDTTFSLEPEPVADRPLRVLQGDLRVLADELAGHFWVACDALAAHGR
jgi:hypothetical protein